MMRAVIGQKRVEVVEKITESGTWPVPAGCRSVEVWVIGGGGGGGSCGHAGGGGGGGGAANGNQRANGNLRNGGSGAVILKYMK